MLTDCHGRYTQRSVDNPDCMWGGVVRIGSESGQRGENS